ncbi:hypothetical protein LTR66_007947 [Elasticomyces elasticus]|nr:hypothetical protein LTR66_007947 [Elasticomyces elasticus]KAK4990738.1 hypothetical protein LTR50_002274 [Elasticomyces elasticus]KAK4999676.1 hypothetical protein LTR28_013300 [Elasticomyces elasticus]
MKLAIYSILLALLAICAHAAAPQKAVIVSYPKDTPDSVVDRAKTAIKEAGGAITHEYKLIKGFAANAPASILESVSAWGAQYNAVIEEDQLVYANGGGR